MINNVLFVLVVVGFFVTVYIFYKNRKQENLVCIIGKKCDVVVNSSYNKTFGIKNYILGIFYYLFLGILVLIFLYFQKTILGINIELIILIISGFALLFSVYLTYIQFFVLKAICDYCLISALINLLIFIVELI